MTRRVLAIGGILLLFVLVGLTVWAALAHQHRGRAPFRAAAARAPVRGLDHGQRRARHDRRTAWSSTRWSSITRRCGSMRASCVCSLSRNLLVADDLDPERRGRPLEVTLRRRGPQPPSEPHFMPHPCGSWSGVRPRARRARPRQRSAVLRRLDQRGAHDGPLGAARPGRHDQGPRVSWRVRCPCARRRPMGASGTLSGRWRLPDRPRLPVLERGARQSRSAGYRPTPGATRSSQLLGERARLDRRAAGGRDVRAIEFDGSPWVPAGRFPP